MADVLIRDIPEEALSSIDAKARRQGLSRVEYLRRQLIGDARRSESKVTVEDLKRTSQTFADATDPKIMARCWDLDE